MRYFLAILFCSLVGCSPISPTPTVTLFEKGSFPDTLDAWGLLFISEGELVLNDRVIPYDLKSALFTDYAHKLRTVYVPEDKVGVVSDGIALPVGSILSKTFYYPKGAVGLLKTGAVTSSYGERGLRLDQVQLIETRLLVRLDTGWVGLPYVWNEEGSEAVLEITGAVRNLTLNSAAGAQEFDYVVPDFNQCQGCHIENLPSGEMAPVGFKPRHLDKGYNYFHKAGNQLDHLATLGIIDQPPAEDFSHTVDWHDPKQTLEDRARSYLDINCGHCHNPTGPADTSGMFLTRSTTAALRLGVCKPPVAAGQGTGGRPVGIYPGHPEKSILAFRMGSLDLGAMMPELGRSLVHDEGVALVSEWIGQLKGDC
jgi:uncharacterized repeat protein (TIGR03806 family)